MASTLRRPREYPASRTRRSSTQRVLVHVALEIAATGATVSLGARTGAAGGTLVVVVGVFGSVAGGLFVCGLLAGGSVVPAGTLPVRMNARIRGAATSV